MNKQEVKGQVSKVTTMADQSIRITIDIPQETAPDNIIKWQFATVTIIKEGD